jgi:hypothetical protein
MIARHCAGWLVPDIRQSRLPVPNAVGRQFVYGFASAIGRQPAWMSSAGAA